MMLDVLETTTAAQREIICRIKNATNIQLSFGFCGKGEGFCTPSTKRASGTTSRARPANRARSGAGCVLDNVEWVGGDLPAILGGGGIKIDRDTADECFNR